ncbi:hypothetical protein PCANC_28733 [Puccinia coronata f. sp. avenae]|uniref:Uncharacterized protein n=1 Tax=Puccinia coronata f. sp. avenae TaxID=200324 RepID=A0A2N5TYI5_9BASI|nr:hypothetical protein PCASD_24767 [Puccinia coronata f. sp. avenae]PLW26408.1 hypothetical protein PCANC_28733 [Puccinia coronata f. sp. avenae]PLW30541.1 hypothetical protein PCASD_22076 [Puccinia coronata f. sp. avenae]
MEQTPLQKNKKAKVNKPQVIDSDSENSEIQLVEHNGSNIQPLDTPPIADSEPTTSKIQPTISNVEPAIPNVAKTSAAANINVESNLSRSNTFLESTTAPVKDTNVKLDLQISPQNKDGKISAFQEDKFEAQNQANNIFHYFNLVLDKETTDKGSDSDNDDVFQELQPIFLGSADTTMSNNSGNHRDH